MATPECPGCEARLTAAPVRRVRPDGGGPPRWRRELWWACRRCGWRGLQHHEGGELRTMRPLPGAEGHCWFCGEGGSNVAGEPWRSERGDLLDLVVCLACGNSQVRRVGPAPAAAPPGPVEPQRVEPERVDADA
ncbi:hypothetical protein ACWGB8_02605 [Kitasatospora sp. NPDC054939]